MIQTYTDLLTRMKQSPNCITPSAYDTAWAAWLYPEARAWLVDVQHPDGSWGTEWEYYHDRVIATLSAINAIAATSTNRHELQQVERGIRYLEKAAPHLGEDVFETAGFELILPRLVNTGKSLGLNLDRVEQLIESQKTLYYQKLALIPKEVIYCPDNAIAHNLEFLGFEELDQVAVNQVRAANGSIHHSNSATAFVEIATKGTAQGKAFLDGVLQRYNGTMPGFSPLELLETIWTLYPMSLNVDLKLLRPVIDSLIHVVQDAWTPKGIGWSKGSIVDPDDTALGLKMFYDVDINQDPNVLETFEVGDHFQCYPFERNISLGIHIHIVEALKGAPDFPRKDDMLLKALNILGRDLTTDFVTDKWHSSPYYSTGHTVIALTGLADNLIKQQIQWLLKTQREDGSWTFYPQCPKAAIEETAHALLALMVVQEKNGSIPVEVIERGIRYLTMHYRSVDELPALWIHKNLYRPYFVVESIILSTLFKYEQLTKQPLSQFIFSFSSGS